MAASFVALCDPVHDLLRSLTRHTPLALWPAPGSGLEVQYRVRPEDLPDKYWALALFHARDGMPLEAVLSEVRGVPARARAGLLERVNFFDALTLDRRCSGDVRLRRPGAPAAILAGDLLAFGVGTLRAGSDLARETGTQPAGRRYGRLHTSQEVVYARIRTLCWDSLPLFYEGRKECFDSTNIIYGDVLGEVEQLWERRADTLFLEQAARTLQGLNRMRDITRGPHAALHLESAVSLHLGAQAVWKTPPSSARALLRRLEYILEHTTIDPAPATVFGPSPPPRAKGRRRAGPLGHWTLDRSGYDGWLSSEG